MTDWESQIRAKADLSGLRRGIEDLSRRVYQLQRRPGIEIPEAAEIAEAVAAEVLGACIADYIVDSNGGGTNLSLFGAGGALEEAIATGLSRTIYVCSGHVETITAMQELAAFATDQQVVVFSLGRTRPLLSAGAGLGTSPFLTHDNANSGAGSHLRFQGLGFSRTIAVGTGPWFGTTNTAGFRIPEIELVDVQFQGDSLAFSALFDLSLGTSCNPQSLLLNRVWSRIGIRAIFKISSVLGSGNISEMRMTDCRFASLRNIQERVNSTDVDIGRDGIMIIGNIFEVITDVGWSRTYTVGDWPFIFANNNVFDAQGAVDFLQIGTGGTTSPKDAAISGNHIRCSAAGASAVRIYGGAGTAENIAIVGNDLRGPGSGTAVKFDLANIDCAVLNAYRDWDIKVGGSVGPGAGTITGVIPPSSAYSDLVKAGGAVAYWRLGETSGPFVDSADFDNPGTENGTLTRGVAGAITGDPDDACTLNGTTGFISVADHADLDVGDVFTLEAWIKKAANGTDMSIIAKAANGYQLRMSSADTLQLLKENVSLIVSSTVTITDTDYHHIVATKDGATVKLYIDGVDVTGVVTNATIVNTTQPCHLGRRSAAADEFWNGTLDEVAIYPTALTSAQVLTHFEISGSGSPPSAVQTLAAATAILANAATVQIDSVGAVTLTATPTIANGNSGQRLRIINIDTADTITLQDETVLAGSNLRLAGAANYAMGPRDVLDLIWNTSLGDWIETGRSNN